MSDYRDISAGLAARMALEKYGFRFSHALGQNFILDDGLVERIVEAAGVAPGARVLEIGPGAGVMTRCLAARGARVTAVELDRSLEPVLSAVLEGFDARLVFEDILKLDIADLMGEEPFSVVANLPYSITADVVLTRLLALNTPVMKIGLGFAAVALCAMLYGPGWAALTAALGDLLGALLFPTGAYFPGFTLTAACTGLLFGLCLYRRPARWTWAAAAAGANTLLVSYLANTAMICLITGNSLRAMLTARAVQLAVTLPVQLLVLTWLKKSPAVQKLLRRAGEL